MSESKTILVMCTNPKCGEIMRAPAGAAGKKARCPFCRTIQPVPAVKQAEQATVVEPDEALEEELPVLIEAPPAPAPAVESSFADTEEPPPPAEGIAAVSATDAVPPPRTPPPDKPDPSSGGADGELELSYLDDGLSDLAEQRRKQALGAHSGIMSVFILGLVGMVIGLVAAVAVYGSESLWAVYLSAGAGWAAGMILALVGVTSVYWVGESDSPDAGPKADTMVGDCLRAPGYGTTGRLSGALGLAFISLVVHVVVAILWRLAVLSTSWPLEGRWGVVAVCIVIELLFLAYVLGVFVEIVRTSAARPGHGRPSGFLTAFGSGIRALGVVALYVFPLVTIPLIPFGLLALGSSYGNGAYSLRWAWSSARRRPAQLVILWLMLWLWASALTVAAAIAVLGAAILRGLAPELSGYHGEVVRMLVYAGQMALLSVGAAVFLCAMFRCVGVFGRRNRDLVAGLPERMSIFGTLLMLGGLTIAGLIVYQIVHPALAAGR